MSDFSAAGRSSRLLSTTFGLIDHPVNNAGNRRDPHPGEDELKTTSTPLVAVH